VARSRFVRPARRLAGRRLRAELLLLARVGRFADDAGMRLSLNRKVLLAFLFPLAAVACSSPPGETGSGGTGGTGTGGATTTTSTGGTTGSGGSEIECEGAGFGGNEKELAIGTVKATVVDQAGMPAGNVVVQACGTDVCINGLTNGSGSATVAVNDTLTAPALKYGDGLTHAKFASLLAQAGDSSYADVMVLKLAPFGVGDMFAPGATATSNGVSIEVPADGVAAVDNSLYEELEQQVFRAVLLPAGANVPAVDPAMELEIVYGAAPVETVFCPPAKLRVPNTPQWAAGAAVEVFVHGLDVAQHWAPYAGWQMVGEATVSADGTEVVTDDGKGLPVLSTFALRLKK